MAFRCAAERRVAAKPAAADSTTFLSSNKLFSTSESGSDSNVQTSTSGSSRCHLDFGLIRVPIFGRASTNPLAARIRTASRYAVRDTANRSLDRISPSSRSPGLYSPDTIAMPNVRAMDPCSLKALPGDSITDSGPVMFTKSARLFMNNQRQYYYSRESVAPQRRGHRRRRGCAAVCCAPVGTLFPAPSVAPVRHPALPRKKTQTKGNGNLARPPDLAYCL